MSKFRDDRTSQRPGDAPGTAPFGSWKSPITPEIAAGGSVGFTMMRIDGPDIYWLEHRPAEGGRSVLVRRTGDGAVSDLTPQELSVRNRVHEYGGGEYAVSSGMVIFSAQQDERLYRQEGQTLTPITPPPAALGQWRYADLTFTPDRKSMICVRETHSSDPIEPRNELVILPVDGSRPPRVLASGHDFYSFPRVNPDGTKLAWTTWDHPQMPWDGTELWLADLHGDHLEDIRKVAGGPEESLFQPSWSPRGELYVVSDRSGWWNLYRVDLSGTPAALARERHDDPLDPLLPMEAEFGQAQWVFGLSSYAFLSGDRIACWVTQDGEDRLGVIGTGATRAPSMQWVDLPYRSAARNISIESDGIQTLVTIAGAPDRPTAILSLRIPEGSTASTSEVLRESSELDLDPGYFSKPRTIRFPSADGRVAHAYYYPPQNPDYVPIAGSRPPLLVESHGGPTARTQASFDANVQFWTSRGFAVVDVNYGGSSGYGRAYRNRLRGSWGIVDTEDCVAAARWLVKEGLAEPKQMAIRGGSAGGYTTLCALAFHDLFQAGASHYGVADLEAIAVDTHKFESRYCDSLVGPYPEAREIYRARSPIHHTDRLSCPIILFQGLLDAVVPPSQSEAMIAALAAKKIPYAYVTYPDERHGFRNADNVRHSLLAELSFYAQVFGFEPADPMDPVPIVRV